MATVKELLKLTKEKNASDLHLCVGLPAMMRVFGRIDKINDTALSESDLAAAVREILPKDKGTFFDSMAQTGKDIDFSVEIEGVARFRVNVYRDRKGYCLAFRLIPREVKPLADLGLPKVVEEVCAMRRGLVLVTGVTGSGKSTTLASILDRINIQRQEHIITVEDPIEFLHEPKKSIINQREVGAQTTSFAEALRSSLREDPDVILVGEMRDLETMQMAITAAETGHLVLSTLHTRGAAQTVSRIIDVFPAYQQPQVREQLADTLSMVISQVLIPGADGNSRFLGCEVMVGTVGIKNLIREQQTHQINSTIQIGGKDGMQTLDASLKTLVDAGKVKEADVLPWLSGKSALANQ